MLLNIPNMTCGGCARAVTKAIQAVDAGARVEADPPGRTAQVETRAGEAAILGALQGAGFPATVRA